MPHFSHLVLLWGFTVILLFVFFMFRFIQHFRHETSDSRLLEWEKDDIIHYGEDDDEL